MHRLPIVWTLFCLYLSLSVSAQDGSVTVSIFNESDKTICMFVAIPQDDGNPQGAEVEILPNATENLFVQPGNYDLVGVGDCDGNIITIWSNLDLNSSTTLVSTSDFQVALSLNDTAKQLFLDEQYEESLIAFEQSLAIYVRLGDRQFEGKILDNMGQVYKVQGEFLQALDHYTQSLAIAREVDDKIGEARTLRNMGNVYIDQAQYGDALDVFLQALPIMQDIGDRTGEGYTLSDIGSMYYQQGQLTESLTYLQASLLIMHETDDQFGEATTLSHIGLVYTGQGLYEESLASYDQALQIVREIDHMTSERAILSNMGQVYSHLGQEDKALAYYFEALSMVGEISDSQNKVALFNNIGQTYTKQLRFDEAIDLYSQALEIAHDLNRLGDQTIVQSNRAESYEFSNQIPNAISDYRQTIETLQVIINNTSIDSAISSLAGDIRYRSSYQRLSTLSVTLENELSLAFEYVEQGRAILTRTELTTGVIDFRADADQSLLDREFDLRLELQDAQRVLDTLRQNNGLQADITKAQNQWDTARSTYDRHLEMMQLQGGYLAREISFQTASLEQIQSVIPENTTLLAYSLADERFANLDLPKSVVFLVTPDSLDAVILDVTEFEISDRVRAYASGRRTGDVALRDLYDMVIAPIADKITTSNLIISPDQSLNYAPFAALFTEESGERRYLIDNYSIRMIPSGTILWLLSQREKANATANGLVMSQDQAPGLPPLPNAFEEILKISQLLGVDPMRDGTETQLRNNVSGNSILHISAHAELNRFAPLYSVIHLGGDDTHDGRLEIREIYELDLSHGTDLVILSGCETGSGGDGEDFGLMNRAFFAAGAQEVLASLWVVDDRATADLLVSFMENRETAGDSADALRQAMLALREQHPDPYLWASFVINGIDR
jgi:tetratricopeptide (TPR) repeat protein